jgi:hypothetical protein
MLLKTSLRDKIPRGFAASVFGLKRPNILYEKLYDMIRVCKRLSIIALIASCFFAESAAQQNQHPEAGVSWTKGIIVSRGTFQIRLMEGGRPEDPVTGSVISLNRERIEAYLAARDRAMQGMADMIRDIRIDPDTRFDDLLVKSDEVQSRVADLIAQRVRYTEFPVDFFTSGCRAELVIADLLQAVPNTYPANDFPTRIDNPIPTDYTGLIIDARRLGIEPMILPSVFDENGLEVYGRYNINIRHAMPSGIVRYVYTDDEAMKSPVAGSHPYYTIALGKLKGCPVISDRAVRKIFSSAKTIEELKKNRVIFIIDKAVKQ